MNNARSKPAGNPWNKNPPPPSKKNKQNINANHVKSSNSTVSSENKFLEAQRKLQAAIQKHVKHYESSSEEEELESDNLIESVLKVYTQSGGNEDSLGRTRNFLSDSLQSGAHTCLICICRVKRDDQIWSCLKCSSFFHLICIQRWSKDTITHQKQALTEQILAREIKMTWGCPKCRCDYAPQDVPTEYLCFCKKTANPKFEPLLVPHSCGEICKKDLVPPCGHKCLLLCHPGLCPPCPVTVSVSCFCGSQAPKPQRCSNKEWSCGERCGKLLECGKHSCSNHCHAGKCSPCSKKSIQKCLCGSIQRLRDCASPVWQCDRVCNKPLDCGLHKCLEVCHSNGCSTCILSKPRTCPCGKETFRLPCTEDTPTCKDTCNKLLECGEHRCNQRCHKDKCGPCLETVEKQCRCKLHSKEVQCCKVYLCDTKCKNIRDCNKHPCNRKCCDGNCPPCERPCDRTLNCGNHKCNSVCHKGPCYPCSQTKEVACRCGFTKIKVPCGTKHNKIRPPKCHKLCLIPPDCHHDKRLNHSCHFGDCPPCRQTCDQDRGDCPHPCSANCHSAVLVKIEGQKASMPWEQTKPQIEKRALPCPDCVVPVSVTCIGDHETADWPCYLAKPSSCQRPCGRVLECGNHTCALPCHEVIGAPDNVKAGTNCEACENPCSRTRPDGCQHTCPKPCHPGPCPPCKQMLRIRCHCELNQIYVECSRWLEVENREQLQSCGNQCPKNFECGHRCRANCHSGPCPNAELCKKKMKVTCKCKRLKKEFQCEMVRNNLAKVECDEVCIQKKEEQKKLNEELAEERRREEEEKNKKELEKYQKMFDGKKKHRERKVHQKTDEKSLVQKYWLLLVSIFMVMLSVLIYSVV